MTAIQAENLPIKAKIAGPFQDIQTQKTVSRNLENLHNTEYVGPRYGVDKDNFYDNIDVLIFPTKNDAEPLTVHEAMSRGIPVIAYGRGSIPEIVDRSCGLVIPPEEGFVPAALAQIRAWNESPDTFRSASEAAAKRSSALYAASLEKWEDLKSKMTQGTLGNNLRAPVFRFSK
jgi:glycosyltransferase involved in cell wall biosynthesis